MQIKKGYYVFLSIILFVTLIKGASAAHYITGSVEDALDFTLAENRTIMLWNPDNGVADNLTDIIGFFGNSGQDNDYSIDCELLNNPCVEGDILSLKVINNGDNYISEEKNVSVSSLGFSVVEDIRLNSPPIVYLVSPENNSNFSNDIISFNCSFEDLDHNLKEVSLYGDWGEEWELNETKEVSFGEKFKTFTKKIIEGVYFYSCQITDSLGISKFAEVNNTFTIDLTPPKIESILFNITHSCGYPNLIQVNCNTYDGLSGINNVTIQSISPSNEIVNYSAEYFSENRYYSDVVVDELGLWIFSCVVYDNAGNNNKEYSEGFQVYSSLPELVIKGENIELEKSFPIEYENVSLNAIIENKGCSDAENVTVKFFEGDPNDGGSEIRSILINVSANSNESVDFYWITQIGLTQIFVVVDYDEIIVEEDESNNKAHTNISITAWQDIYGNIELDKVIGDEELNIRKWYNQSKIEGHVFITDSECEVNWMALAAIGKTKSGKNSSNDFLEIDEILGMDYFEDSISNLFSNFQIPKETVDMIIYQREIKDVPIIKSSANSSFITGILWDTSDDSGGEEGEYDKLDKEDLIFVTEANKLSEGEYGVYDYEIKIPSRLREYFNLDKEEIYLYYNLD